MGDGDDIVSFDSFLLYGTESFRIAIGKRLFPSHMVLFSYRVFVKAFGGALGDTIDGGSGQDIILGDFGLYDADVEFLPYQHYKTIIDFSEHAGDDTLIGTFSIPTEVCCLESIWKLC